jgi:acyl-CoA thioesterase
MPAATDARRAAFGGQMSASAIGASSETVDPTTEKNATASFRRPVRRRSMTFFLIATAVHRVHGMTVGAYA